MHTGDKGQETFWRVHEIVSKCNVFLKAVDLSNKSRKEIGALGERIAAEYVERHGMKVVDKNFTKKTGEIDLVAQEGETLHFIEVKSVLVNKFFDQYATRDEYDPSVNLHAGKIHKVARTGEWYVLEKHWEGDWQVDGCLVWFRRGDGAARVQYLPQIV